MAASRKTLFTLVVLVAAVAAGSQWWASRQQLEIGRALAGQVQPGDIQMLSSTTCGICTTARLWFQTHQLPFEECFIEKDAACAARFQATRAPGTPVILVRGQQLVGFDPARIRQAINPG